MPSLTIASSAYNEEESLERMVCHWLELVPSLADDYEILLVNDGSTDRTAEIMEKLRQANPHVRVIHHESNLGFRGFARTLCDNATKELFVAISCDGEYELEAIRPMMRMVQDGYDVVIGVRKQLPNYNRYRKIVSRSYNRLVKLFFGNDFKDAGSLKLFRLSVLRSVDVISQSAFMNAERLIKAERSGFKIGTVEIEQHSRLGGRARGAGLKWVFGSTRDLFRVAWQIHSGKWRPREKA